MRISDWSSDVCSSDLNGEILLEAENRLRQSLGHKAVALRLSGLYGPGRTQLLNRLRQAQAPVIQEPPQWTNRMHIEDAARACAHLLMLDELGRASCRERVWSYG